MKHRNVAGSAAKEGRLSISPMVTFSLRVTLFYFNTTMKSSDSQLCCIPRQISTAYFLILLFIVSNNIVWLFLGDLIYNSGA